jgi:hypothetical protein
MLHTLRRLMSQLLTGHEAEDTAREQQGGEDAYLTPITQQPTHAVQILP